MRPMSHFGNPFVTFVHVRPPLVDLWMPASRPPPIACPTWRRRWYEDAYITTAFFGSSTMSVMPVFSLIVSTADQVFPPSLVLYNPRSPPDENSGPCAATNTTFELRGSITILPMCSE